MRERHFNCIPTDRFCYRRFMQYPAWIQVIPYGCCNKLKVISRMLTALGLSFLPNPPQIPARFTQCVSDLTFHQAVLAAAQRGYCPTHGWCSIPRPVDQALFATFLDGGPRRRAKFFRRNPPSVLALGTGRRRWSLPHRQSPSVIRSHPCPDNGAHRPRLGQGCH